MNTDREKTCEERVEDRLGGRLDDLRELLNAEDNETDELGSLCDYGLSVDYVAPGTFNDQREGYVRYQLSWGGPSDEFRFFVNPDGSVHRVEYWFLDWFDGAPITLIMDDEQLLLDIYEWGDFKWHITEEEE